MKKSVVLLVPSFLLLLLLLSSVPAQALTYVRGSDQDLADQAAVIAEVRVLAVDPSPDAARPVTDYAVEVTDLIAGYLPGSSIVVRVTGGQLPDGAALYVPGAPRFAAEQTALLFLEPRADGTWGILHLALGAFRIAEAGDGRFVYRDLSEATEIVPPGGEHLAPEQARDLERFRAWLRDRARGTERDADYWLEALPAGWTPEKYTLLGPSRWREFDTGGSVTWRAHSSGQPGQSGGGLTQVRRGLDVWTNHACTPIRYLYGGTTSATGGFEQPDGVNGIIFNDPNNEIDGTFQCGQSGTLAIGGFWWSGQHNHNGTSFRTIVEGDIITNDGIDCLLPGNRLLEELIAHELGHTLGLGHSNSRSALMWPYIHDDGRGAQLRSDDKNGIIFLYGDPPVAPSDLEAEKRNSDIRLTWRDNASCENNYEVWRSDRSGGGFDRVAREGSGTTSWEDDDCDPGRRHWYKVRATNPAGPSDYSGEADARCPGTGDLIATPLSQSVIRLTWEDSFDDETGFEIEGKVGDDPLDPFALMWPAPADVVTLDAVALLPETLYTFRFRAVRPEGPAPWSDEVSAMTYPPPCECVADPTTMCLDGGRFRVRTDWRDIVNATGDAQVVDFGSNNSGLQWFFSPNNWEMLIKVLDGCAINQHFWVFAAATTNVEYNLEVTDCWTNEVSHYQNPLGVTAPAITDTEAFTTCAALPPELARTGSTPAPQLAESGPGGNPPATGGAAPEKQGNCVPSDTTLCLDDGRFQIELEWKDYQGVVGPGHPVLAPSVDSGLLYFFNFDNWEMLIKVLDGCAINNHYWVFFAATTTVEFTLKVTDTQNGAMRVWDNELDHAADTITETEAFATCP